MPLGAEVMTKVPRTAKLTEQLRAWAGHLCAGDGRQGVLDVGDGVEVTREMGRAARLRTAEIHPQRASTSRWTSLSRASSGGRCTTSRATPTRSTFPHSCARAPV